MNNVNKIKFITIFITFILLSFLLTGCSEKYQDLLECLEVNLSEISINNYTASVTEDGDKIFYLSHDGIYKIGKKSLVKERICKTEAPQNLYVYEGQVFFTDRDRANLFRIGKDGNKETIVESSMYRYTTGSRCIEDYFIDGSKVYIFSASMAFSCDMTDGTVRNVVGDEGVSALGIYEGKPVFIEHASETFTVYSLDTSGEKKVILGANVVRPAKDIITDFRVFDDLLFCTKRSPDGVFVYENGIERELFSGKTNQIFVKNGNLFFSSDDGALYRYDGQLRKIELSASLPANGRFIIIDSICLFKGSDGMVRAEIIKAET